MLEWHRVQYRVFGSAYILYPAGFGTARISGIDVLTNTVLGNTNIVTVSCGRFLSGPFRSIRKCRVVWFAAPTLFRCRILIQMQPWPCHAIATQQTRPLYRHRVLPVGSVVKKQKRKILTKLTPKFVLSMILFYIMCFLVLSDSLVCLFHRCLLLLVAVAASATPDDSSI